MPKQETTKDEAVIYGEWHVRYKYSIGKVAGKFFDALKQKKILATHCAKCNLSFLPPRAYCERSFEPCDGWVEAGQEGVIEASTIVTAAFENLPTPPYAIAYVRLDGISTALINFIRDLDLSDVARAAERIKPGTRVRVKFKENPEVVLPIFTTCFPQRNCEDGVQRLAIVSRHTPTFELELVRGLIECSQATLALLLSGSRWPFIAGFEER